MNGKGGNLMDSKTKELVAIAASVTQGCMACLDAHVRFAREAGADSQEIQTAINIARAVRLEAVTRFDEAASEVLRGEPIAVIGGSSGCGPGCNC